jgi:hypothetical protein
MAHDSRIPGYATDVYYKTVDCHSTLNVKFKIPTLLRCRADHPLHVETNPSFPAFKNGGEI